jgi:hypothetical protein
LTVTIYGWEDEIKGVIVWDGTRITASGSIAVRRCAREPIAPHGISNEIIKPDEQPEQFMRNLWLMLPQLTFGGPAGPQNHDLLCAFGGAERAACGEGFGGVHCGGGVVW